MHNAECWNLTLKGKIEYCICGFGRTKEEDEQLREAEDYIAELELKLLEKTNTKDVEIWNEGVHLCTIPHHLVNELSEQDKATFLFYIEASFLSCVDVLKKDLK